MSRRHVPGVRSRLAAEARDKRTVILDVGGERFIATRDILAVFPATRCSLVTRHTSHVTRHTVSRLGKLVRAETIEKVLELCDEFTPGDPPEYFFDRNPDNFPAILNMYRTGVLCRFKHA